jgi:hypothetical protein
MQGLLEEEITEEFLEELVGKSIERLLAALNTIDVSLDYIAAAISDEYGGAAAVSARQTGDIR